MTTLKALEPGLGDPFRWLPPGAPPLRTMEKSNGIGGIALTSISTQQKKQNNKKKTSSLTQKKNLEFLLNKRIDEKFVNK